MKRYFDDIFSRSAVKYKMYLRHTRIPNTWILISVTQVSHWTYETKKEKVDTFIKANSKVLGNLQDQDLKKEMTDKIHKFYEYIEQEEHHAQESLNAMADEMDSRGEPDE